MSAIRDETIVLLSCFSRLSALVKHANYSSQRWPTALTRNHYILCFENPPLFTNTSNLVKKGRFVLDHCPTQLNAACPTRHVQTFLTHRRRLIDTMTYLASSKLPISRPPSPHGVLPTTWPILRPATSRSANRMLPTANCREHDLACALRLVDQQIASSSQRPADNKTHLASENAPINRVRPHLGALSILAALFCSTLPLSNTRPGDSHIHTTLDLNTLPATHGTLGRFAGASPSSAIFAPATRRSITTIIFFLCVSPTAWRALMKSRQRKVRRLANSCSSPNAACTLPSRAVPVARSSPS